MQWPGPFKPATLHHRTLLQDSVGCLQRVSHLSPASSGRCGRGPLVELVEVPPGPQDFWSYDEEGGTLVSFHADSVSSISRIPRVDHRQMIRSVRLAKSRATGVAQFLMLSYVDDIEYE